MGKENNKKMNKASVSILYKGQWDKNFQATYV